jgi:hypothetical protein
MTLTIKDSPAVAQAWLVGVNPELGDRVPIRLLKESNLDQVAGTIVGAARAFAQAGKACQFFLCFWRRASRSTDLCFQLLLSGPMRGL